MDRNQKTALLNRLKSVVGHLNGIVNMVEDDRYCVDIMKQIQATQAALNKINQIILEDHLHHCVIDAVRGDDPDARERALIEISDLFAQKS
ncbi:MAG: copper-sensing transcriptional repressor CsoR [Anaerolineae bacterium]